MPVDIDDLIQLLSILADEAGLKATVKESLKGGFITGVMAAAGGLIIGPPGLAVGKGFIYDITNFEDVFVENVRFFTFSKLKF